MKRKLISLLVSAVAAGQSLAEEGVGRAGMKEHLGAEVEAEFYAGRRGYLHGGLGAMAPISERQTVGFVGHVVREETGGELFPSLGVEFIQDVGSGFEVEAFSFGYFPVEKQSAWAAGLRGSRRYAFGADVSISPFFGPTFAQVRALDEASGSPVNVDHLMLLGGISAASGPVELTVFGSHSFFSRDTVGLETHVDLEEMTHFAAYENNDGFARTTAGTELSWAPVEWLALAGHYAFIRYEDATRHSFAFRPAVNIGEHLEVFAGIQFLRGDGPDNDLVMSGAALSF